MAWLAQNNNEHNSKPNGSPQAGIPNQNNEQEIAKRNSGSDAEEGCEHLNAEEHGEDEFYDPELALSNSNRQIVDIEAEGNDI